MKWKMLRKMMKVGTEIYGLECRDGFGVRNPLNDRERVRLRNLRRYYDGHRLHQEYQLIMTRRWDQQIEQWDAQKRIPVHPLRREDSSD